MKKKKIYIDFDKVIHNHKGRQKAENLSTPRKGVKDFLKNFCENYEIYVFTTRDREKVYKWMIRYHLDEYIQDVTNTKVT